MTTEYKIRDKETKLFSTGGYCPEWTKKGKSWKTLAQVQAHLKLFQRGYPAAKRLIKIPLSWEIVEYRLIETKKGLAAEFDKPLKISRKRP